DAIPPARRPRLPRRPRGAGTSREGRGRGPSSLLLPDALAEGGLRPDDELIQGSDRAAKHPRRLFLAQVLVVTKDECRSLAPRQRVHRLPEVVAGLDVDALRRWLGDRLPAQPGALEAFATQLRREQVHDRAPQIRGQIVRLMQMAEAPCHAD